MLNKSEMCYDDMIHIMEHGHKYVPTSTQTVEVDLPESGDKQKQVFTPFCSVETNLLQREQGGARWFDQILLILVSRLMGYYQQQKTGMLSCVS